VARTPGTLGLAFFAALVAAAVGCGDEVTVEQTAQRPLNVCSCMDTRQAETPSKEGELGPCMMCWVETISGSFDPERDAGVCHYAQQRCLDEQDCLAITACVGGCEGQVGCTESCLQGAPSEMAHDMYMDWMRCFCAECFDVCNAHDETVTCDSGR